MLGALLVLLALGSTALLCAFALFIASSVTAFEDLVGHCKQCELTTVLEAPLCKTCVEELLVLLAHV
jgi:hypothetical protein